LLTGFGSHYASGMMLTLEEFRATRRRTDDAQSELGFDYDMEAMPAFDAAVHGRLSPYLRQYSRPPASP
jgi:hypothetical protein